MALSKFTESTSLSTPGGKGKEEGGRVGNSGEDDDGKSYLVTSWRQGARFVASRHLPIVLGDVTK